MYNLDLALDLDLAPDLRHVASEVVQQHLGLIGHLDPHGVPSGLHPGGHIHCVAKQAVSRRNGHFFELRRVLLMLSELIVNPKSEKSQIQVQSLKSKVQSPEEREWDCG